VRAPNSPIPPTSNAALATLKTTHIVPVGSDESDADTMLSPKKGGAYHLPA
jgi:hypothetical protein